MPSATVAAALFTPGYLAAARAGRERPLLLLIDGYSLVFRSYFGLIKMGRPMSAPDGFPTTALYAFTTMLLNAIEQFKPDQLVIGIDAHAPTFREELFPAYKGQRDEAPDDLKQQLIALRDYMTGCCIPWIEQEGLEADDIIGTLATRAAADGYDVVIITGDKDQLQLTTDRVAIYLTMVGTSDMRRYGPADVMERFGVSPERFVDYRGLTGDPSDNIPGVPGIGDKTAQKLLSQFATLEDALAAVATIEPKGVREKLSTFSDQAKLSKRLAWIVRDADVAWDPKATLGLDPDGFRQWFMRLGFRSLLTRYGLADVVTAAAAKDIPVVVSAIAVEAPVAQPVQVTIVQTMDEVRQLIGDLKKAGRFALDFETTGLNPRTAELVGIALAYGADGGYYIPVGHHDRLGDLLDRPAEQPESNLPLVEVLALLKPLFEDPKLFKVVQNGKYEYAICLHYGIHLAGMNYDTFVASYVLNPDEKHGLKDLAQTHLGMHWGRIEALIGKGKDEKTMAEVPIADAAAYAVHDAVATWRLFERFASEIATEGLSTLFDQVEIPMVPVLAEMEDAGIRVDPKVLEDISRRLGDRIAAIEAEAAELLGHRALNLNSPKQLSEYLFNELRLTNPKRGSTDIEVLEEIRDENPLIPLIIENRELTKLQGTYLKGLLPLIEKDGRIHTNYNQGVAATGRLASSNPNLQNIPIRTEL
ncbi:MAG: DNA polymerase, partial [bacterium]